MDVYLVPAAVLFFLIVCCIRKENAYNAFVDGAKQAVPTAVGVLPCLVAIFLLLRLCEQSGITDFLSQILSPVLTFLGIPPELCTLVVVRPFSGSAGLATLQELLSRYGADSYVGRCASVVCGSTETVFYVAAVYFSETKVKKLGWAIPVALFCAVVSASLACLFCRLF